MDKTLQILVGQTGIIVFEAMTTAFVFDPKVFVSKTMAFVAVTVVFADLTMVMIPLTTALLMSSLVFGIEKMFSILDRPFSGTETIHRTSDAVSLFTENVVTFNPVKLSNVQANGMLQIHIYRNQSANPTGIAGKAGLPTWSKPCVFPCLHFRDN